MSREGGFPDDQYVWVYSRVYAFAMRRLHEVGRHWYRRTGPEMETAWCDWCGSRKRWEA